MDFQSKEWHELQEYHLSLLTQWGIEYTASIEAGVILLQDAFLGENGLSQDEQREIFAGLVNTAKKHSELVRRSLQERKNFVDTQRGRD